MKFDFLKNSHWTHMPVTDAFERTILRENFSRMRVLSVLLLMTELVIYMFRDMFFNIGGVLIAFIVMSLVMIPIIWLTYEYLDKISTDLAKLIQYVYAFGIISFGSGLSFAAAAEADLVHMYFMTVFGVLITVYMKPAESFFLLLVSYLTFTLLLPFYQENDTTVLVTRINSMIFTTFAWSQSRLQFNVRHRQYLDQATIENKNIILEESVRRDAMTGLLNHSHSIEALEEAIKSADLSGSRSEERRVGKQCR